jgi:hypothetical protein
VIRNVLESIQGVATFPLVSLVIFTLFFAALIITVLRLHPGWVREVSRLPLDDSPSARPQPSGDDHV